MFAITVSNGRPFPPLCDCYYMEILYMHLLRYGILPLLLLLSQISYDMCGRQLTNNWFKNQNVIASSNFISSSHMFSQSLLLGFFILRQIHLFFFLLRNYTREKRLFLCFFDQNMFYHLILHFLWSFKERRHTLLLFPLQLENIVYES